MTAMVAADSETEDGAELTHQHRKQTNHHLYARNDEEDPLDAFLHYPIVAIPRKGKSEHVLEYHETGEGLDGNISCGTVSARYPGTGGTEGVLAGGREGGETDDAHRQDTEHWRLRQ